MMVARGRDVIGRDRVTQDREHARTEDVVQRLRRSGPRLSKNDGLRMYVDAGVPRERARPAGILLGCATRSSPSSTCA